jgi:membrane protease YdiL (CAAX protease family)
MQPKELAANIFEYGLVALGWILIWRLQLSRAARERNKTSPQLPFWPVPANNFAMAALCVFTGWFMASALMGILLRVFPVLASDESLMAIVGGSISELCLIAGVVAAAIYLRYSDPTAGAKNAVPTSANKSSSSIIYPAVITFVITISIVYPVQWLWEQVLVLCHLPTEKQEMVAIFYRTGSSARIAGLAGIAILLAPVAEELVFRASLFRFLRGRLPHWAALALPALIFAAMHVNRQTGEGLITLAPLTAFGLIFSIAYERTGRITVVILAHALFNLHTVIFLLLGLGN